MSAEIEKVKESLKELRNECNAYHFDENGKKWYTTNKEQDIRCNTIENALNLAEEMQKALEIIVKKRVCVWWLKKCSTVKIYNRGTSDKTRLTQAEFDLVKKVVEKYANN